jgi:uncharacterized LabA/DUF88 family protein
MAKKVAVFVDWQNCYNWARRAFHADHDPSPSGQVRPGAFAQLLAEKGPGPREVVHIGMYRGRPDPRKDPKTYAAHMRHCAAWERECGTLLNLRTRTLRYPHGWPSHGLRAEEKGIDVQFAIDAMLMAARGEYDVAILATADSDLLPVAEGLMLLKATGGPDVEVIGWGGVSVKLEVPDVPVRWIGPLDYKTVRDNTDYNIATR